MISSVSGTIESTPSIEKVFWPRYCRRRKRSNASTGRQPLEDRDLALGLERRRPGRRSRCACATSAAARARRCARSRRRCCRSRPPGRLGSAARKLSPGTCSRRTDGGDLGHHLGRQADARRVERRVAGRRGPERVERRGQVAVAAGGLDDRHRHPDPGHQLELGRAGGHAAGGRGRRVRPRGRRGDRAPPAPRPSAARTGRRSRRRPRAARRRARRNAPDSAPWITRWS